MLRLLSDLAKRAEATLGPGWYDDVETGAGEEISRREAEVAWHGYRLRLDALTADLAEAMTLLGAASVAELSRDAVLAP